MDGFDPLDSTLYVSVDRPNKCHKADLITIMVGAPTVKTRSV